MNNVNDQVSADELLSALADGELDAAQAAGLVQASHRDAALLQTWASYHAIGHALRAQSGAALRAPQRVALAVPTLALATASAAIPTFNVTAEVPPAAVHTAPAHTAANDSVFRWKLVAGVAALAAVGSMVWALVGSQTPTGAQLAQRSAPANAVASTAPVPAALPTPAPGGEAPHIMIRDPRLDELLAAHKQFGGASALQQPAGFLRNATFQPHGR